jgi:hypothetical protein
VRSVVERTLRKHRYDVSSLAMLTCTVYAGAPVRPRDCND